MQCRREDGQIVVQLSSVVLWDVARLAWLQQCDWPLSSGLQINLVSPDWPRPLRHLHGDLAQTLQSGEWLWRWEGRQSRAQPSFHWEHSQLWWWLWPESPVIRTPPPGMDTADREITPGKRDLTRGFHSLVICTPSLSADRRLQRNFELRNSSHWCTVYWPTLALQSHLQPTAHNILQWKPTIGLRDLLQMHF